MEPAGFTFHVKHRRDENRFPPWGQRSLPRLVIDVSEWLVRARPVATERPRAEPNEHGCSDGPTPASPTQGITRRRRVLRRGRGGVHPGSLGRCTTGCEPHRDRQCGTFSRVRDGSGRRPTRDPGSDSRETPHRGITARVTSRIPPSRATTPSAAPANVEAVAWSVLLGAGEYRAVSEVPQPQPQPQQ